MSVNSNPRITVRMERVAFADEPHPEQHTILLGAAEHRGERIVFAGDRRSMDLLARSIAEYAEAGEQVYAVIEPWQVLWRASDPDANRALVLTPDLVDWLAGPGSGLQRCWCGHSGEAHDRPHAERVPWGECHKCGCREFWPLDSGQGVQP